MNCPYCEFDNPLTNLFCGKCGSIISKRCPACEITNPLVYDYCGKCGTSLNIPTNRFGRQEPSATYSYFPSSGSAFVVDPPMEKRKPQENASLLRGERRVATVIVADVKKSMDLLEKIRSEAWVELMSKLLQVMEAQIYRFGGQVDQFRGDGLVAFFGARDAHEDDPERAVLAALAMQEGFERYKLEFDQENTQEMKLRVGIHTDDLIVAKVGTQGQHLEDTAMGEAIALAARLESAAEPGSVLVSSATYHLVAEKFHWIDLGQIRLKGISAPVQVYRPITIRSDAELLKDMQNYLHSVPLIGRYEEYNLIRQKVDQVIDGRGEIMLIAGERGLGKSHLVKQVHKDLALRELVFESYKAVLEDGTPKEQSAKKRVLWLRGWTSSYEQQSLFFIWQILLKSWLGIEPDETNQEILTRLTRYCEALWPDQYQSFLPMLASLLSLPVDIFGDELSVLDAQGYQGKLFHTLREWLRVLSENIPVIVSLGNVQWANPASIELLRDIVSLSEDHPILWFIVYRPDKMSPVWNFQHFLQTEYPHRLLLVNLTPFEEEESKALIEYILQPNRIDEKTLDIIVARTEGNPFFISELVNSLVNDGVLVKDDDSRVWTLVSEITSSDLPESLHSLFLARIDKLSSADRQVLQIASVIGFIFWKTVILIIAPDDVEANESLNNLLKFELIQEIGAEMDLGVAYQFSSTLIKDVTYESILSSQRRDLHAKIGEFLQSFQENPDVSPGLLAYHFEMAGNLNLELFYRIRAAEQSRNYYANQEAYQEYSRALMILDDLEAVSDQEEKHAILTQKFELVKNRIEVLYHLGRVIDAQNEARKLLAIADLIEDDPVWRIDALLVQPGVNYVQTQEALQEGIPQAEEALRLSREVDDPYREMQSLAAVAGHRFLLGDPNWQDYGQQAINIADELGDHKTKVEFLLGLAGAYGMDKLEMGLRLVKEAQPIAEEINFKSAQVEMLYWLGTEFERQGDYYTLLRAYEEKRLQLARDLGWRLVEARSLMFVGQIKGLYLGDYKEGLKHLDKAEKLWQDVDQRLFVYLRQAQIYVHQNAFDKARHYLALAEPLSVGFVQSLAVVGYELVCAILHLQIGSMDSLMRVIEHAEHVLHVVEEENLVSRQYRMAAACKAAQAQLRIGKILQESHDMGGYDHYRKKAIDFTGMALDTYNDFGFTQIIEAVSEEILFYHGVALRENGLLEEAETYLKKAHEELIRKFSMIPEGSHYRKTFMNMELHQKILEEGRKY